MMEGDLSQKQVRTEGKRSLPATPHIAQSRGKSQAQKLRELYALPAPLRTFPLPTFIPHNPLSLFHILYVWISQNVGSGSSSHFDPLYIGLFSPETRSVHVTDTRAIRGLWEQGFYGKGTLSRSEPNWLVKEKSRKVEKGKVTSEEYTNQRRAIRQKMKWERAKLEREAIEQKLLEEASSALETSIPDHGLLGDPPPKDSILPDGGVNDVAQEKQSILTSEPIAITNSLEGEQNLKTHNNGHVDSHMIEKRQGMNPEHVEKIHAPPVGPMELLALPNSSMSIPQKSTTPSNPPIYTSLRSELSTNSRLDSSMNAGLDEIANSSSEQDILESIELVGGSDTNDETVDESGHSDGTTETSPTPPNGVEVADGSPATPKMKRHKSVRFSPTVEKNTFIQTEPPSPKRAAEDVISTEERPLVIRDQEHLQLTLEETFFLAYGLGAIAVLDPETKCVIPNKNLFTLCRRHSYFPPRLDAGLSSDDPFLVNYVVYHHFRSLGWVVRSGVKFSVDYMLYNRGPVFSHAEFAVLILPSYSDPYWQSDPFLANYAKSKESRTWAWMSCIQRVITQVKKTLILCYVDIPKPLDHDAEGDLGITDILAQYKVREFVMGRFSANRMRSSAGKQRVK